MKNGRLLGSIVILSLILVLAIYLPLAGGCAPGEKMHKIGLTQIVTHPALDEMHNAFIEVMAEEGSSALPCR